MATDVLPAAQGLHHSPETREIALATLVKCGGSPKAAYEALQAADIHVPYTTLCDWRHRYSERITELHEQLGPELDKQLEHKLREVALHSFAATQLGVEKALEQLEAGDVKDAAGAARNLATTGAIATDKLNLLLGRPTQITQSLTPDDTFTRLANKGYRLQAIDATAEEIPQDPPPTRQLGEGRTTNAGAEPSSDQD
jgi:hypothetical protein